MTTGHPQFGPAGPDSTYQPTTTYEADGSVVLGTTPHVRLASASTAPTTYQMATSSTAVAIIASGALTNMRTIKALLTNTAPIYIGRSDVAPSNGFPLQPGESFTMDAKFSTAAIYAVSAAAQAVAVFGF